MKNFKKIISLCLALMLCLSCVPAAFGGLSIESELLVTIKVTNFPVYELPKTGSNTLLIMPLFGLLGLTACAAVIVTTAYRRKKV